MMTNCLLLNKLPPASRSVKKPAKSGLELVTFLALSLVASGVSVRLTSASLLGFRPKNVGSDKGQSLTEFALVLPIMLLLLFILLSSVMIGRAYFSVQHAASQAARTLSVTGDSSAATSAFSEYLARSGLRNSPSQDFLVVQNDVGASDVTFAVVYFQRALVPWVDRLIWGFGNLDGASLDGHVSLRVSVTSRRE